MHTTEEDRLNSLISPIVPTKPIVHIIVNYTKGRLDTNKDLMKLRNILFWLYWDKTAESWSYFLTLHTFRGSLVLACSHYSNLDKECLIDEVLVLVNDPSLPNNIGGTDLMEICWTFVPFELQYLNILPWIVILKIDKYCLFVTPLNRPDIHAQPVTHTIPCTHKIRHTHN